MESEGVHYKLVVTNEEYDLLFQDLSNKGLQDEFILCKIHGSIEQPESIIALASAYKSSKGFSENKSKVFGWLLERYYCLFLGYSGWDFEHANYRKFWDHAGTKLKGLFWNRRPKEEGGPKFPLIFNSCKQKFLFSEADLPVGWIDAMNVLNLINMDGIGLTVVPSENESKYWEENKKKRLEFFDKWAGEISEYSLISMAIAEGVHFTAKFQEMRNKTLKQARQEGEIVENAKQQAEKQAKLQSEMQEVAAKLSRQEISMTEYQQKLQQLQLESLMVSFSESDKQILQDMIAQNKFPGITDNPTKVSSFVQNIGLLLKIIL